MAVQDRPSATDQYAANRDATREKENRFPGDQMLRDYGFVIESRPVGAPATWRRLRDGRVFSDQDARMVVLAARAKSLKALEKK